MKLNLPLKELCPEKKTFNHRARKSVVKKLKKFNVLKCEINYDSGDEQEQQMISRITDNTGPVPSRSILSSLVSSEVAENTSDLLILNFTRAHTITYTNRLPHDVVVI